MNNKTQTLITITMAIATGITLAKSLLNPSVKTYQVAKYSFPQSVDLTSWELTKSIDTLDSVDISGDIWADQQYVYQKASQNLTISARYLTNTEGDIKSIVEDRTSNLSQALKQNPNGGYALYTYQGKAYLDSCINPRGSSTVTSDRFKRNRTAYDLSTERIVPWFQGKKGLQDKRCLWMQLTMDLKPETSEQDTYKTIESIWLEWAEYWQDNFPEE